MSTFQCVMCGGVFERGRPDEEAYEEAKRLFGMTREECDAAPMVCDDCFAVMTAIMPPDHSYIEAERAERRE